MFVCTYMQLMIGANMYNIMTHCHRDEMIHCHDHRSVGTYERDVS